MQSSSGLVLHLFEIRVEQQVGFQFPCCFGLNVLAGRAMMSRSIRDPQIGDSRPCSVV
jgi:hypothetical protein